MIVDRGQREKHLIEIDLRNWVSAWVTLPAPIIPISYNTLIIW